MSHRHECKSYREGDWIIFYCLKCKNYIKKFNARTGEFKTKHANLKHK